MDLPVTSNTKRYQVFLSIITQQTARLNVVYLQGSRCSAALAALSVSL
jgi:hypothetical protein